MSDFATIARRFESFVDSIGGTQTQRAVTGMLIAISTRTKPRIPVATAKLINSEEKKVRPSILGWSGELSYDAGYAKFVHDAPGTLLGTNTPRSPASLGFVWSPSGEPKFLRKGATEAAQMDFRQVMNRSYIK